jgi:WD40-like Beta Propeller Repeat
LRGIARLFSALFVGLLMLLLPACQQEIKSPAPAITSLSPANISAGHPAFTLQVFGSHFTPASLVTWNGSPRSSLFQTTSEIDAQILSTDIENAGQANVAVITEPPGGGTTKTVIFTITGVQSNIPSITAINPATATTGGAGFALTITGTNFVSQSTVLVNGAIRPSSFESSTQMLVSVLSTDLSNAGTLQISVVNPAPGGGSSNFASLHVVNPVPVLSTLSPTAVLAGSAGSLLTITGSDFVPDSVVTVNGAPRTTTFSSATTLLAALTAGDFAQAGVVQIGVSNPPDGGTGGGTSVVQPFSVNGTELSGLPLIVDLAPNGAQATNGICGPTCNSGTPSLTTSGPSTSQTGEFVGFASISPNLVLTPIITNSSIFLRDTCFSNTVKIGGSSTCVPKTTLVSVTPLGVPANGASTEPTIDSSGTHVAYTSTASNLVTTPVVPGTTRQVYWETPCTDTGSTSCTSGSATTALVSVSADGSSPGNGESYNPVISSDGTWVAFVSTATNLVTDPPAGGFDGVTPQVFVHDTCNVIPPLTLGGCTPRTFLVSVSPDGTATGNGPSSHPAIAQDGLFVAYVSTASNLVIGSNPNNLSEIFEDSTCATTVGVVGNTCAPVTSLVSTPDGATPADGVNIDPAISQEGRFVAFASTAQNLIPGVGPTQEVYVRDTCTGVAVTTPPTCTPTNFIASSPDGTTPGNGLSESPSISGCSSLTVTACTTGQSIAFASLASNLSGAVQNGIENIFVRNPCLDITASTTTTTTGCVPFTLLASKATGTAPPAADGKSVAPSVSGDGNTVSFISFADNLVPNDANGLEDVFLASATQTFTLTVTVIQKDNTASGTVTDSTGQISCVVTAGTNGLPATFSGTCTGQYLSGSSVTLTASAGLNSTFVTWGGSVVNTTTCIANETDDTTCQFAAIQANTVSATFK